MIPITTSIKPMTDKNIAAMLIGSTDWITARRASSCNPARRARATRKMHQISPASPRSDKQTPPQIISSNMVHPVLRANVPYWNAAGQASNWHDHLQASAVRLIPQVRPSACLTEIQMNNTSTDESYRVTATELRQFIERFERLEIEKKDLADQQKEVMAEAKARGYDTKVMRKLVALRKRDKDDIAEEEAVLEMYKAALGM